MFQLHSILGSNFWVTSITHDMYRRAMVSMVEVYWGVLALSGITNKSELMKHVFVTVTVRKDCKGLRWDFKPHSHIQALLKTVVLVNVGVR